MNTLSLPSPSDRFARLVDMLADGVRARGRLGGIPGSFVILLCGLMRQMAARFARIAARGPLAARARTASPLPIETVVPGMPALAAPKRRISWAVVLDDGGFDRVPAWLYQRCGWLVLLAPETVSGGGQLQALLDDPAIRAMAAASPSVARMLRSLCRMLGVPPEPALPPRPRRGPPPADPTGVAVVRMRTPQRAPKPPLYAPPIHYPPFAAVRPKRLPEPGHPPDRSRRARW